MLKGTPSTGGWFAELGDAIAEANALSVQRLLDAGAVIIGKTNIPLYCADYQSANPKYGRTNNPFDLSRSPGGSSGGSSAALACGFAALEIGSDVAGSVRSPAHFCGVCSHKPSYGIGHLHGHAPMATHRVLDPRPRGVHRARYDPSFHHALAVGGPMARCCADLELAMRILAQPEPVMAQNGWAFTLPPPRATDVRALRAAAWFDSEVVPTDREYLELLQAAAESLQRAGAHVDFTARPFSSEEGVLNAMEAYMELLGAESPALNFSGEISHEAWIISEYRRNFVKEVFVEFFDRFDVLLCPVMPVPAVPHTEKGLQDRTHQGVGIPGFSTDGPHMIFWNFQATMADLPSTVVPVGFTTTHRLPCGMQIMAPHFQDLTAIEVGRMLEQCHPLTRFVPPPGFHVPPDARL